MQEILPVGKSVVLKIESRRHEHTMKGHMRPLSGSLIQPCIHAMEQP